MHDGMIKELSDVGAEICPFLNIHRREKSSHHNNLIFFFFCILRSALITSCPFIALTICF